MRRHICAPSNASSFLIVGDVTKGARFSVDVRGGQHRSHAIFRKCRVVGNTCGDTAIVQGKVEEGKRPVYHLHAKSRLAKVQGTLSPEPGSQPGYRGKGQPRVSCALRT